MLNQMPPQKVGPQRPQPHRRLIILSVLGTAISATVLTACSPKPVRFKSTEVANPSLARAF